MIELMNRIDRWITAISIFIAVSGFGYMIIRILMGF